MRNESIHEMIKVKRISLLVFWKHAFKISDFFSIINQLQAVNSVVIFYVLYLKPKVLFSFTSGQYYWWYDEIFSEIHFYLKTISKAFLSFFFWHFFISYFGFDRCKRENILKWKCWCFDFVQCNFLPTKIWCEKNYV